MKIRLAPSIVLAVASSVCLTHAAQKPLKGQSPAVAAPAKSGGATGWFNWRGPSQNGTSPETGLPDKVDAKSPLWTADFPGQGSPVIARRIGPLPELIDVTGGGTTFVTIPELRECVAH